MFTLKSAVHSLRSPSTLPRGESEGLPSEAFPSNSVFRGTAKEGDVDRGLETVDLGLLGVYSLRVMSVRMGNKGYPYPGRVVWKTLADSRLRKVFYPSAWLSLCATGGRLRLFHGHSTDSGEIA